MKIAIVGPTHPYKGGIAQHTTELARHLQAAGHDVTLVSWKTQYPFFYPGAQFVPLDKPEVPPFENTRRVLSWKNPAGWLVWGRRLRKFDRVILVWWVPTIQGPVYLGMLRAMGRRRNSVTLLCHNVLPHEPRPGDKRLVRAVLKRAGRVIVHSEAQLALARDLTTSDVIQAELPLPGQGGTAVPGRETSKLAHHLLFFGIVRPYKGVDVLLQALADVPGVNLTIAGEFWGGQETYTKQIEKLKLTDRVTIKAGYVPTGDLPQLMDSADALVLPYRKATATFNVALAHSFGKPVIATTAGSLAGQVHDGVNGLLCEPGDAASLAAAIKRFYEPGVAKRLREGIPKPQTGEAWRNYTAAVTGD